MSKLIIPEIHIIGTIYDDAAFEVEKYLEYIIAKYGLSKMQKGKSSP